jgi:hypothetical protein
VEVVKAAHDASFKSVVAIVLQSADTSELQVSMPSVMVIYISPHITDVSYSIEDLVFSV